MTSIFRRGQKKISRRTPEIGAGKRHSEIVKQNRGFVIQDASLPEVASEFGRRVTINENADFEVYAEVMGPHAVTPKQVCDDGFLLIMGKTGTLYVEKFDVERQRAERLSVRPGEFVFINAGEPFMIASGNDSADYLRIQTSSYDNRIQTFSEGVKPHNPHIPFNDPFGLNKAVPTNQVRQRRVRKSLTERQQLAEMLQSDGAVAKGRRQHRSRRVDVSFNDNQRTQYQDNFYFGPEAAAQIEQQDAMNAWEYIKSLSGGGAENG